MQNGSAGSCCSASQNLNSTWVKLTHRDRSGTSVSSWHLLTSNLRRLAGTALLHRDVSALQSCTWMLVKHEQFCSDGSCCKLLHSTMLMLRKPRGSPANSVSAVNLLSSRHVRPLGSVGSCVKPQLSLSLSSSKPKGSCMSGSAAAFCRVSRRLVIPLGSCFGSASW
jgi:hypothetical protein